MQPRSIALAALLLLGVVTLTACGSAQLRTQSYGYDGAYYQLGRDSSG
jgi:hypothetical protein